jgi:starch phosphorylase
MGTVETLGEKIRSIPDSMLWECRASARETLIDYIRERLVRQRAVSGAPSERIEEAKHIFDANTLTLGFARRFAPYKRPNLLLHDPERLLRILTDQQHPVQLIVSGKAHPADQQGQAMISQWIHFTRRSEVGKHVAFISDYDMLLTERLVQGVDVWINTPRRPWEACGTSGMKVLVNGGLNLSELDGWWAEAYTPEVGWALGDGREHGDDPAWDAAEAETLYELLEQQVIPEFYSRDQNGIPTAWVGRIRESMARLTPLFSANRAVREYTDQYYIPAAAAYRERAANKGAIGVEMVNWLRALEQNWGNLRLGEMSATTIGEYHVFEVQVYLNGLETNAVNVELYAEGVNGGNPVRQEMMRGGQLVGAENGYTYGTKVLATRPDTDYTVRIIPHRPGVAIPLEASRILWQ